MKCEQQFVTKDANKNMEAHKYRQMDAERGCM